MRRWQSPGDRKEDRDEDRNEDPEKKHFYRRGVPSSCDAKKLAHEGIPCTTNHQRTKYLIYSVNSHDRCTKRASHKGIRNNISSAVL